MQTESSAPNASYNAARVASGTASSRAPPSSNPNLFYSQTTPPKPRSTSPSINLDSTDRPDSAQRSRNAAVSLTALSSAVPSRNYSPNTSAASSTVYSPQTLTYIPSPSLLLQTSPVKLLTLQDTGRLLKVRLVNLPSKRNLAPFIWAKGGIPGRLSLRVPRRIQVPQFSILQLQSHVFLHLSRKQASQSTSIWHPVMALCVPPRLRLPGQITQHKQSQAPRVRK